MGTNYLGNTGGVNRFRIYIPLWRDPNLTQGMNSVEKFLLFIVGYFIVVNFVLPRFGLKPG